MLLPTQLTDGWRRLHLLAADTAICDVAIAPLFRATSICRYCRCVGLRIPSRHETTVCFDLCS